MSLPRIRSVITASGRRTGFPRARAWVLAAMAGLVLNWLSAPRSSQAAAATPSDYLVQTWETDHGLPQNSASGMVQTRDGYLWFGTFDGLVRFNGTAFTTFDRSNTPEFPDSSVINLYLDASERLWVSTMRGLLYRDMRTDTHYHPAPGWSGNYVRTFSEAGGVLCLTAFDGGVFRGMQGRLEQLPPLPGAPAGCFGHVDPSGRIWAARSDFFGFWDGERWKPSSLANQITNELRGVTTGLDGSMVLLLSRSVLRVRDDQVVRNTAIEPVPPGVWSVREDSEGTLWVSGRGKGLYTISAGGEVTFLDQQLGVAASEIRFTFEDRERNVWVGSNGGGLTRLKRGPFRSFSRAEGLPERIVKAVVEDGPGQVAVGTYGRGIVMIRDGKLAPSALRDDSREWYVQTLLKDRQGRLWAGGVAFGIRVLEQGVARKFEMTPGLANVAALFQDSSGGIWAGGDQAVLRFDENRFLPQNRVDGQPLKEVRCFAEDPANKVLWAASPEGLFQLSSRGWEEVRDDRLKSLRSVLCLCFDRAGALWAGSEGDGLRRLRLGRWSKVTEQMGLPCRLVTSMTEDASGYFWLGSNRGVLRVQGRELERVADGVANLRDFQLYNLSDGLPSVECSSGFQNTVCQDSSGKLWFATVKGLAVVDPARIRLNTNLPPVVIEQVAFTDGAGARHRLDPPDSPELVLPPGSRELEIHFAVLNYAAPEKVRSSYQILGGKGGWVEIGNRRAIYFPTLAPGPLRLQIRAANNDGVWNESGSTLTLEVRPFLWQRTGFQLFTLAGLVGAATLTARSVLRRGMRRDLLLMEQQRRLDQEKARLGVVLEAANDFIGFADREGHVLYVNSAGRRLVGLDESANLHGSNISQFHPPETVERIIREAIPAAENAGMWRGETELLHRDGHRVPVSQVIVAHPGSQGNAGFLSTIIRDISERKQAENQIRRLNEDLERRVEQRTAELNSLNKELEAFSYSVSHDLRAPLANISGFADLLARNTTESLNEAGVKFLDTIKNEARRMGTLIDDLLALSKLGRAEMRKGPVPMQKLAAEVWENLALQTQGRKIDWKLGDLPVVQADANLLRHVLANLLSNAIKYSRSRPQARIEVGVLSPSPSDHEWVFFVRDDGVGFNMKYVGKLFGVFQRLHSAREFEGTGIGLANVQRIIHRHGGRVWAEAALDQGATFFFSLPK